MVDEVGLRIIKKRSMQDQVPEIPIAIKLIGLQNKYSNENQKEEGCYMPDHFNSSYNDNNFEIQGSILRGILGSVTGMIVCILAMLLCSLFQMGSFSIMIQIFAGVVIGWFYRLFRGRRSKTAAYVTVGICTVLASVLWVALLALLPVSFLRLHLQLWIGADCGGRYGNCCFCALVWV